MDNDMKVLGLHPEWGVFRDMYGQISNFSVV